MLDQLDQVAARDQEEDHEGQGDQQEQPHALTALRRLRDVPTRVVVTTDDQDEQHRDHEDQLHGARLRLGPPLRASTTPLYHVRVNPFGIETADAVEASHVVGDFWHALAAEDFDTIARLVAPEILGAVTDAPAMLEALELTPKVAIYMGTSTKARVLDDGSLMFISKPTVYGAPEVIGASGPETIVGHALRLLQIGSSWKIVGINDVGDRERIDWIDLPLEDDSDA
jgi:hypothetical protein